MMNKMVKRLKSFAFFDSVELSDEKNKGLGRKFIGQKSRSVNGPKTAWR